LLASEPMLNCAVRLPTAVGAKLSVTLHVALTARAVPTAQVPLRVNSAAALPVRLKALKLSGAAPLLRTVRLCCALVPRPTLPNVKALTPPRSMLGCGLAVAMPFKFNTLGLPTALCVMLKVPGRLPAAPGVKAITRLQLVPAATLPPAVQVLPLDRL
jgi:hypothetical protein